LSIVDINHGHQPMFDSTKRYSIIFNGEIDNPIKLRSNIMDILNRKNNNYCKAEQCWKDLSPYIWEKSILNKNYRNG
jgi:asparagine synthetase B (glutamine-hydrolysing)